MSYVNSRIHNYEEIDKNLDIPLCAACVEHVGYVRWQYRYKLTGLHVFCLSQTREDYLARAEEVKEVQPGLGDRYAVVPQGDDDDVGAVPDFDDGQEAKKPRLD
eukprot:scaffold141463_cov32-Prasinocladus_malaysianus.AAC.1